MNASHLSCYVLTFFVAATMLTGCGQSQPQDSQVWVQTAPLVAQSSASPCNVPDYYYFHGACVSGKLPAAGETLRLNEYRGITYTDTVPKNNGDGTATLTLGDATGRGDITSNNGSPFPKYPKACAESSCRGTAFWYGLVNVKTKAVIKTQGKSTFTFVDNKPYPGNTCQEAGLTTKGWEVFGDTATPKGETLRFSDNITLVAGPYALTAFCY